MRVAGLQRMTRVHRTPIFTIKPRRLEDDHCGAKGLVFKTWTGVDGKIQYRFTGVRICLPDRVIGS
jgi:hypothetical protein